jgi:hypothetical protein
MIDRQFKIKVGITLYFTEEKFHEIYILKLDRQHCEFCGS